ncbi:MAG: glycosyltransferase family 2 protein [Candidatus Omnitrophica bacterium]|nr:glycosyltransferase family 2 protein [Candidatus Omnitrophota bacterium]
METGPAARCVAVIPAYRAEGSVGPLVRRVAALGLAAVVVDDASGDATAARAQAAGAVVLSRPANGGKGRALRDGFQYALASGFEWIIALDADGQHETGEIPNFLRAAREGRGQLIVGDRMRCPRGMPLTRWLTNLGMSWILSRLAGTKIPDTQCGFRMIHRGVLEKLTLTSDHFEIESEMVLKAAWAGYRVASIPVASVYTRQHLSFIRPLGDTARFFRMLWRVRRRPG